MPADTPPELAAWIQLLHGPAGMPDPRGCELRWVVLTVGTDTGPDTVELVTTGWVLPRATDADPAFVIAWNGLLYQAAAVGDAVTLDEAMARTSPELARSVLDRDHEILFGSYLVREGSAREAWGVTTPRLGLAGLLVSPPPTEHEDTCLRRAPSPPCLRLLAADALGRAIGAQARGDDLLAIASVERAAALRDAACALGDETTEHEERWLVGWDQLDALAADLARRAAEPPDRAALDRALAAPEEHVALLVSELDEVSVAQRAWPGGPTYWHDPVAEAVLRAGSSVVLPLLDATDDDRFLRGVGFFRPFAAERHLVRASDLALALALASIERHLAWADVSSCEDLHGHELVACVRAVVTATPTSPVDGWRAILASENRGRWPEAARRLARPPLLPCRVSPRHPRLFSAELPEWRACEAPLTALAEGDRDELRRLLLDRLGRLLAGFVPGGDVPVCELALALVALPGEGAREGLRAMALACTGPRGPCTCLPELTVARVLAGDDGALAEWATWMRTHRPSPDRGAPYFAPAWLYPDRTDVQDAVREVLRDLPLARAAHLPAAPFLGSPALREWILRALASDEPNGEWQFFAGGGVAWGDERWERVGDCSGDRELVPRSLGETTAVRLELLAGDLSSPTRPRGLDRDAAVRATERDRTIERVRGLPWGPAAGPAQLHSEHYDCGLW